MIFKDDQKFSVPKNFAKTFDKTVVYELHPERTAYNHNTNRKEFPRSVSFEPFYTVLDGTQTVTIRYAKTAVPSNIGGMTRMKYDPPSLVFNSRGQIICDPKIPTSLELHYWLSLHPQNADSANFDASKQPLFYRVDHAKTASKEMALNKARHQAEGYIYTEWDENKLREIARSFDVFGVDDLSLEEVQLRLITAMKPDPEAFIDRCLSQDMILRSQISEGVGYGILTYDDDRNGQGKWAWGEKTAKAGMHIVSVRPGEDAKDRLIRFFRQSIREDNVEYFLERLDVLTQEKEKEIAKASAALSKSKPKTQEVGAE